MTDPDITIVSDLFSQYRELMPSVPYWPRVIAVTGALGSGKTEWVLNLALGFASLREKVTIADIDIINPYFCIRQVAEKLEKKGFRIITTPENAKWSDMSVVSPKVSRALAEDDGRLLLDIGGDAEGALALKQFEPDITKAGYLLILVVNSFRPQTSTVAGIEKMLKKMESICGLSVGALVSNSHLMAETEAEDCVNGLENVLDAGRKLDLPVLFAGVDPRLYGEAESIMESRGISVPLWPVARYMMLPWEDGAMWSRGETGD
ncbi:MAG: hypothetical protein PHI81_02925 [Synergistaceae bacterium]|uniref:hypothetical protein n=1 Tax=Aminivibrio sp. TaxID=1872489 RepID=UPI002A217602|nr:hypothetical protein [Synergistaceae bacterium]MDD3390218.1 hypothetical protein [Synergistaceae bacterium]MDD3688971.1 hypothetical protein [Synergistaceae bacterium]MDD4021508.1 hypothetical protein [Synergistaceae bacterium]MDD4612973.1 hypothetical protein [Synergistaceae bacterium]